MVDYFYTCNFCDIESPNAADFKRHLNGVHFPGESETPKNVTKPQLNAEAGATSTTVQDPEFEKMDESQVAASPATLATPPMLRPDKKCSRCDFRSSSLFDMAKHFASSCKKSKLASDESPTPTAAAAAAAPQQTPESEKLRGCIHCSFKTGSAITMAKHVLDNHQY